MCIHARKQMPTHTTFHTVYKYGNKIFKLNKLIQIPSTEFLDLIYMYIYNTTL